MKTVIARPAAPQYHGPIGKCIYCGTDGAIGGLSKEHAMPTALEGSHVIRKASCEDCREITRKIEEINLRGVKSNFGVFRIYDDYQTSHPKERPTKAPLNVRRRSGVTRDLVPVKDRPPLLILPEFGEPGILTGSQIGAPFFNRLKLMRGDGSAAQAKYGGEISVDYNFDLIAFMRLLAKIAHSMAVVGYGLDGFEPILPDFILGRRPELAGYLIGQSRFMPSASALNPLPRNQTRHEVSFRRTPDLIAAGIRLFATYPTPTYFVAVGKPAGKFVISA